MTGANDLQTPLVQRQVLGDVAVVRMCDPATSNALTPVMVTQLIAAFTRNEERALVICAEGRNFCSGGDHDSFLALSVDGRRQHLADIKRLMVTIRRSPAPTVACMQGAVVGGGLELALHCDLLVAADNARFQLPHVATNSKMRRTSYVELVARTGVGFARRMSLLGEFVASPVALSAGLVDMVMRHADLFSAALSMAQDLAAQPSKSMDHARSALAEPGILLGDTTGRNHGQ